MDVENGVFFSQKEDDDDGAIERGFDSDGLFLCPDSIINGTQKALAEWAVNPQCGLKDSEPEEVLPAFNPNDVCPSGPPGEPLSESDSGISDDLSSDSPSGSSETPQEAAAVYQVVYDLSNLANIKTEPEHQSVDVISIELDEWSSHMLIPDSCIVSELPLVAPHEPHGVSSTAVVPNNALNDLPIFPDLELTEEEQKLLNQEGVSLPNNLPLTKAEERILKKVRRKIRNKQSAQDSRRRKKEYIDGLESRVAACSVQNHELHRTVERLEKHNMSLMAQLRKLQALIKQTATKAAQTSTCVMIILFSLALIIFPSYSPFGGGSVPVEVGYAPIGVISRNILTNPASAEDTEDRVIPADPPTFSPVSSHEDPANESSAALGSAGNEDSLPLESQFINISDGRTDALALGAMSTSGQESSNADPNKPAHADEM